MSKETPQARQQRRTRQQETAYLLAKYLVDSHADRKTVSQFAKITEPNPFIRIKRRVKKKAKEYLRSIDNRQTLPPLGFSQNQKDLLVNLRTEIRQQEEEHIEEKRRKRNFSVRDRTMIAIRAVYNRMPKEEKIEMFRQAGYKDNEMPVDLSKRAWQSGALSVGILLGEEVVRGVVATKGDFSSLINQIPDNFQGIAAALSILAYTGSYAAYVYQNLRLAKRFGRSANPVATTFDSTAKHLFRERASDTLAVATTTGFDALMRTVVINSAVGFWGGSEKIIATNAILALINLSLIVGAEGLLRVAGKKKQQNQT
ncbi:MAG TPA: hypothetical protein VLF20_03020 [Patescibacteria group bacterium]|nr:hypothetical protein [Patescibacteria group bacterium]